MKARILEHDGLFYVDVERLEGHFTIEEYDLTMEEAIQFCQDNEIEIIEE